MNEAESMLMEFQGNNMDPHSFFGLLFTAMFKADSGNISRLQAGFPDEVEAVIRWKSEEDYAKKLKAAYADGKGTIDGIRIPRVYITEQLR